MRRPRTKRIPKSRWVSPTLPQLGQRLRKGTAARSCAFFPCSTTSAKAAAKPTFQRGSTCRVRRAPRRGVAVTKSMPPSKLCCSMIRPGRAGYLSMRTTLSCGTDNPFSGRGQ